MKPLLWSCCLGAVLTSLTADAQCARGAPCPVVFEEYASPPPMVVAQPLLFVRPEPVRPRYVYVEPAPVRVVERVAAPVVEGPSHLAIKYLPGLSTSFVLNDVLAVERPRLAHSLGLELRFNHWLTLRSDYEMRAASHSWDIAGLKVSLPIPLIAPYVSASLSASEAYREPGRYQFGAVAAAGLDLKLGRHFFIEAEGRFRVAPGSCCREEPQVSALIGAGVAFF